MSMIDSLNRLQRAGSEHSRATAKLHESVRDVADLIERTVPHGVLLPRGYIVHDMSSNIGSTTLLFRRTGTYDEWTGDEEEQCIDYNGGRYLHGDFGTDVSGYRQTRASSLRFAADVADVLLDEIAAFLTARAQEADAASAQLAAAIS